MPPNAGLSVRRLINHGRNRSDDASDSQDMYSSSPPFHSQSPSRKQRNFSPHSRPNVSNPVLHKVNAAESSTSSSSRRVTRPPQLPTPTFGDLMMGEPSPKLEKDVKRSGSRAQQHHRQQSDTTTTATTAPPRQGTPGTRAKGQQMKKPPPLMHERPLKPMHSSSARPGTAPQRSHSVKEPPTRPSREPETLRPSPMKRPSLVSHSSDSFVSIRASGRYSSTAYDPGSKPVDQRSKDDLDLEVEPEGGLLGGDDSGNGQSLEYSEDIQSWIAEAERAFQLEGDTRWSLAAKRKSAAVKAAQQASQPTKPAALPAAKETKPRSGDSSNGETTPRPANTPQGDTTPRPEKTSPQQSTPKAEDSPGPSPRPSIPRKSVGSGTSVKRLSTARPLQHSVTVTGRIPSKNIGKSNLQDDIDLTRLDSATPPVQSLPLKDPKRASSTSPVSAYKLKQSKLREQAMQAEKPQDEPAPMPLQKSVTAPSQPIPIKKSNAPPAMSSHKPTQSSSLSPPKNGGPSTSPRNKKSWETRMETKGSKWGLSEGMTDLLTGQRFKKMEVEEMLTPDRLLQLKQKKEAEQEKLRSTEQLTKTKTNEEPVDGGGSWVDLAPTPGQDDAPELSPPRSKTASPDVDKSLPPTPVNKDDYDEADDEFGEEIPIMFMGTSDVDGLPPPESKALDPVNDSLPPIPPKSKRRQSHLPQGNNTITSNTGKLVATDRAAKGDSLTIPQPAAPTRSSSVYTGSSFSPGPATPNPAADAQRKLAGAEDEGNIYLKSTPYTLTRPEFKHGAITFSKADMGKGAMKMDDTMDWTAFQMAILGGAGDFGDVVDEWEDSRLADELVKWFDGHGFEDWGRTVKEEDALREKEEAKASRKARRGIKKNVEATAEPKSFTGSVSSHSPSSSTSSLSSVGSYTEDHHFGSGTGATPPPLNIRRKQPALPTLTSRCMPSTDGSLGRGLADAARGAKSPASRPAVVGGGDPGDVDEDEADAPMGFNLNNDLGEYLQYEAEYAYATDL